MVKQLDNIPLSLMSSGQVDRNRCRSLNGILDGSHGCHKLSNSTLDVNSSNHACCNLSANDVQLLVYMALSPVSHPACDVPPLPGSAKVSLIARLGI